MKLLFLLGSLLLTVNAGTYGGPKTSLEDIERDYTSTDRSLSSHYHSQTTKASAGSVTSPTKFGFVPQRTASSYAAAKPKYQYTQTNYQVKKSAHKPQTSQYQQYPHTKPQTSYQQYYSAGSTQQYAVPEKYSGSDYSQQYTSDSQQYLPQQQGQDYAYVQPDGNQQYTVQYQQPPQQYDQYENVQYVSDNSIAQPDSKQYYTQPQYYYVQQYQSPSTAVESVLDPKAVQYVMFVPSYAANSIPVDQKYQQQYTTSEEPQLPPITSTIAKYTPVVPGKSSSSKQYATQKEIQYVPSSPTTQYRQQEEVLFKREPKSLLDSYVPSIVQLQYLKQQGKSSYSKY